MLRKLFTIRIKFCADFCCYIIYFIEIGHIKQTQRMLLHIGKILSGTK